MSGLRPAPLSAAPALAAVAAALLAGCGASAPGSGYFPLEAGHRWVYDQRTEWENNNSEREEVVLRTLGKEDLNGQPAWHRRSDSGADYWLRADASGIFRVAAKSDTEEDPQPDPEPRYVLKAPLAVGTQWKAFTPVYVLLRKQEFPYEVRYSHKPIQMTYSIGALGQKLKTAAGEFDDCLRVDGRASIKLFTDPVNGFRDLPVTQVEWYCKGVGLVKLERSEAGGSSFIVGGSRRLELVSWQ
jgi:hypothetical protein